MKKNTHQEADGDNAYAILTAKPSKEEQERFITLYMTAIDSDAAGEVARLAAEMAPKAKSFDAEQLAARALQLREAAALATQNRAALLLQEGNWFSLNALYWRMAGSRTEAEKKSDPHLSAILAAMEKRDRETDEAYASSPQCIREQTAHSQFLKEVERRSGPPPG